MNIDQIASAIRGATHGMGTDEKALNQAVSQLAPQDLPRFDQYYKSQYGKTAVEVIKSETRGHFSQLLVEAVQPEPVIAAQSLNAAMKNMGTNEQLLINTLVGRSNAELMVIKQAYQALYKQE